MSTDNTVELSIPSDDTSQEDRDDIFVDARDETEFNTSFSSDISQTPTDTQKTECDHLNVDGSFNIAYTSPKSEQYNDSLDDSNSNWGVSFSQNVGDFADDDSNQQPAYQSSNQKDVFAPLRTDGVSENQGPQTEVLAEESVSAYSSQPEPFIVIGPHEPSVCSYTQLGSLDQMGSSDTVHVSCNESQFSTFDKSDSGLDDTSDTLLNRPILIH